MLESRFGKARNEKETRKGTKTEKEETLKVILCGGTKRVKVKIRSKHCRSQAKRSFIEEWGEFMVASCIKITGFLEA